MWLTNDDESEADGRRDPVRVLCACGPCVDEETDGHEWRSDDTGEQVVLQLAKLARVKAGKHAVLEVEVLDYEGDGAGGEHGQEDEARGGGAEAEVVRVDDGEGLS